VASTLFILRTAKPVSGGYGEEDTPVPIPNTEVKLLSADGTALATGWESRSPPGFILKPLFLEGLFIWDFGLWNVDFTLGFCFATYYFQSAIRNPHSEIILAFLFRETKLHTTFHQTPLKSYEKTLDIFTSLPIM
jgi:hypothetical protein